MPYFNFPADFGQLLDDGIHLSAVRALQIFTGLLKDLLKQSRTGDVVVLDLFHLGSIGLDLGLLQQHLETVLANHLQDHDQVFEVPDVVYGERKF